MYYDVLTVQKLAIVKENEFYRHDVIKSQK